MIGTMPLARVHSLCGILFPTIRRHWLRIQITGAMTSATRRTSFPMWINSGLLIITEEAEALEAMRTGKLDAMDSISFKQAQAMKKTNPEILQIPIPSGASIDPRNDVAPFNDIRVRKAMQMAIDLPTIAKTYYGGAADPSPSSFSSSAMRSVGKGVGLPLR